MEIRLKPIGMVIAEAVIPAAKRTSCKKEN
jgi:hypothetical protein